MITSPVTFLIETLNLSPGSHVIIEDVSWEEYEALLEDLEGDRLIPRINYCHETLELMSPLPAHERPNRIIADIVKALLDAQNRDWEDFGSTTFKKPKQAGLEPDTCFYSSEASGVDFATKGANVISRCLHPTGTFFESCYRHEASS
jgi:Uma2 family endonuclease